MRNLCNIFLLYNDTVASRAVSTLCETLCGASGCLCRINDLGMMTDSPDYFFVVIIAILAVVVGLIAVLKAGCSFFRNMRQVMIFLFA